jgi:hypothetical protein
VTRDARPDSIRRRTYDVAVGRTTSWACRRDQSIPSTSAVSCDAVSRITPSLIGSHRNAPSSSRFHSSTSPDPSQVGHIDEPQELNELAAAVAILDKGARLAGQPADAGQQGDRAVALVLGTRTLKEHWPPIAQWITAQ